MAKTLQAVTGVGSPLKQYQDVIVGTRSFGALLYYELCMWLGALPGAVGMVCRKIFWPRMFASCGKGVLFGAGIVLRHPGRIHLGNKVVISEGCVIDGRNSQSPDAIMLADEVILSNNVMLSCKEGRIIIGKATGLNAQTIIQSTNGCPVVIGQDVIIGQRCFIIGGGNYNTEQSDIPIRLQPMLDDGGVEIGDNVWLGGNVTVLGGVHVGSGSIIAASAVMTKSVPEMSVCRGIPAKVVKTRA